MILLFSRFSSGFLATGSLIAANLLTTNTSAQITFGESQAISDFVRTVDTVIPHDADGDGDLDLFTIPDFFRARAAWWVNDGKGNFQPAKITGLLDGNSARFQAHFAVGDFDQDGSLDLLSSDQRENDAGDNLLQIFISKGGAEDVFTFTDPLLIAELPLGFQSPRLLDTADLNQDGHPDLIGEDYLVLSRGPLEFNSISVFPPLTRDLEEDQFVVANFDADSNLELLSWNDFQNGQDITILKLLPNGDIERKTCGAYRGGQRVDDITTLPGPGLFPDLLVKHSVRETNPPDATSITTHNYLVYRADDTGVYEADLTTEFIPEGGTEFGRGFFKMGTLGDLFLTTLKFKDDLIVTGQIFRQSWDGNALSRELVLESAATPYQAPPFLADLNSDGIEDLALPSSSIAQATTSAYDRLQWVEGTNDGTFSNDLRNINDIHAAANLGHVGDIDGDGDIDIVSEFSESFDRNVLRIWLNDGRGNYEHLTVPFFSNRQTFGEGDYSTTSIIAARDLAGTQAFTFGVDRSLSLPLGRTDFLVRVDFPSQVRSIIGWVVQDSAGAFRFLEVGQDPRSGTHYQTGTTTDLFLDWDGDGTEDIIVIAAHSTEWELPGLSQNHQISLIPNPTSLSIDHETILPSVPSIAFGFPPDKRAPEIALIDMDHDGDLDIFSSGDLFGPTSSYWFERGPEQDFLAVHLLDRALWPLRVDFDGDGFQDFASGHHRFDLPRTFIVLSRAGVIFEDTNFDLMSANFGAENLRDLDEDGDLDIINNLAPSRISGLEILTWNENVRGSFGGFPASLSITSEPRIGFRDQIKVADIDGDGIKDLLVASSRSFLHLEWFKGGRASTPPDSFESWRESLSMGGHSGAALSDYDGDGSSNWDEFIMGTDPLTQDLNSTFRPQVTSDGGTLSFSFIQREGFQISGESSSDLQTWRAFTTAPEVTSSSDSYQKIEHPLSPQDNKRFFRILIDPPPSR